MTRPEFDAWLEEHYMDLYRVALRRTNTTGEADEALHTAIAQAISGGWYTKSDKPWTRMVLGIRQAAWAARRAALRLRAARRMMGGAGASHGRKIPARRRAD